MANPTDAEILAAMAGWHRSMTYVIANRLRRKFGGLDTAFVLRRLKVMERAGKVKRVPSVYAVQICWAPVSKKSQTAADETGCDNEIDGDAAVPAYYGL